MILMNSIGVERQGREGKASFKHEPEWTYMGKADSPVAPWIRHPSIVI